MRRQSLAILASCLMAACSDSSEKYRDLHHLELPPTLPIEHRANADAEVATSLDAEMKAASTKKSPLAGMLKLVEDNDRTSLQINTRIERAWNLTGTALILANLPVIDKSGPDKSYLVRYPADKGLLADLWSSQQEYHLNLKEIGDSTRLSGRLADKTSTGEDQSGGSDESNELIRRLHEVLQEKVINK